MSARARRCFMFFGNGPSWRIPTLRCWRAGSIGATRRRLQSWKTLAQKAPERC
jgi:hypothetical protein